MSDKDTTTAIPYLEPGMTHRRKHEGLEGLLGMLAEARIDDHFELPEAKKSV